MRLSACASATTAGNRTSIAAGHGRWRRRRTGRRPPQPSPPSSSRPAVSWRRRRGAAAKGRRQWRRSAVDGGGEPLPPPTPPLLAGGRVGRAVGCVDGRRALAGGAKDARHQHRRCRSGGRHPRARVGRRGRWRPAAAAGGCEAARRAAVVVGGPAVSVRGVVRVVPPRVGRRAAVGLLLLPQLLLLPPPPRGGSVGGGGPTAGAGYYPKRVLQVTSVRTVGRVTPGRRRARAAHTPVQVVPGDAPPSPPARPTQRRRRRQAVAAAVRVIFGARAARRGRLRLRIVVQEGPCPRRRRHPVAPPVGRPSLPLSPSSDVKARRRRRRVDLTSGTGE